MTHHQDRGRFGRPHVVVRESDDYLTRGSDDKGETEPPNKLIHHVFQPLAVTALIGCITWSVAQTLAPLALSGTTDALGVTRFFWAVSLVMTFVGFKTQRALHGRFATNRLFSGSDAMKARGIELGLLYFGVKLLSHLGDTLPELILTVQNWTHSPLSFFDTRSVLAYSIGVVGWLVAGLTARDMDELIDPLGASGANGDADPRRRIMNRYFTGGGVLLFFTAVNRVNFVSLAQMEQTRISTPIANVLLYFFLGILMLGHVQWMRLMALWNRQKVSVSTELTPTWLRYTLLFVGLAALIAFLLPTGYTVGIMDLVAMAALLISYIATLLYILLLWPFIMLLALLMGNPENIEPPQLEQLPFTPPPEAAGAPGSPWWAVVRSVLFWITLAAVVIYLIRSYLRDRPDLLKAIRGFAPWRWLTEVWRGLRQWLSRVGDKLPGALPTLMQRLRSASSRRTGTARRARGRTPREQIIHHYMTTLDQAQERGLGRRQVETPYEYRKTLTPNLVEGQEELESLTEAFVAARYSTYSFTPEEVQAQAANAATLRQQIKDKPEAGSKHDRSKAGP